MGTLIEGIIFDGDSRSAAVPAGLRTVRLAAGNSVYFFSETAGGPGTKEAIAWHEGRLLYGPSGTCDIELDLEPGYHLAPHDNALNAALRAIGVHVSRGRDEYDTVGLFRHRMTDDWITDATSASAEEASE